MSTFVTLPDDAIAEILLRLPIKSLQRFKCVAKSWYARISDPNFKINHFVSSNNHEFFDFLLINQLHPEKRQVLSLFSFKPLEIKTRHIQLSNANSIEETIKSAEISGPCNGIFCVFDPPNGSISLFNPANQQLSTLPKSQVEPPTNAVSFENVVGFGFVTECNDYKVLVYKHMFFPSCSTPNTTHAELYTLSTNTWKKLDIGEEFKATGNRPRSRSTPSINGIFSWFEIDKQLIEKVIFSYNMKTEVFMKTQLPNIPSKNGYGRLASLKENLAYIHNSRAVGGIGVCYDVWVLGQYGVRESWMMQLSIGPILGVTIPLQFWKNGELLIRDVQEDKLVSYDPVTQEMKDVQARGVFFILQVLPYKESLVSFIRNNDEQETDYEHDQNRNVITVCVTECQKEDLQMIPSSDN
ncbi:hypothetical protein RDABS01_007056 [Bienertia sinuspersici]